MHFKSLSRKIKMRGGKSDISVQVSFRVTPLIASQVDSYCPLVHCERSLTSNKAIVIYRRRTTTITVFSAWRKNALFYPFQKNIFLHFDIHLT